MKHIVNFHAVNGALHVTGYPMGTRGRIEAALSAKYPKSSGIPFGQMPEVKLYEVPFAELVAAVQAVLNESDGAVLFQDGEGTLVFSRIDYFG